MLVSLSLSLSPYLSHPLLLRMPALLVHILLWGEWINMDKCMLCIERNIRHKRKLIMWLIVFFLHIRGNKCIILTKSQEWLLGDRWFNGSCAELSVGVECSVSQIRLSGWQAHVCFNSEQNTCYSLHIYLSIHFFLRLCGMRLCPCCRSTLAVYFTGLSP